MTGRPWLAGDVRRLRELCDAGMRPRLIAAELHRSLPSVYDQLQRQGIKLPTRRRHNAGVSQGGTLRDEIAAALRESPGLVPYREAR